MKWEDGEVLCEIHLLMMLETFRSYFTFNSSVCVPVCVFIDETHSVSFEAYSPLCRRCSSELVNARPLPVSILWLLDTNPKNKITQSARLLTCLFTVSK